MSVWRKKAIEIVPEKKESLENIEGPSLVWLEIQPVFENLVENADKKRINEILSYARWCINTKWNNNNGEQIILGGQDFYQWLGIKKNYWLYFHKWFSEQEFKSISVYIVDPENKNKMKDLWEHYKNQ